MCFIASENVWQRIWMGFHVCFGFGIFHVPSPGNPEENVSCSQLCALPPLCSTSLTGESENETSTNTPLLIWNMYWQLEVLTKQTWLCHGKRLSREGVIGAFPASEVCPALSLRCWGDRALGFFHYPHVMHWFDLFSVHWLPLKASVGATQLPKLKHKPCQVSIVNTTCTKRKQA